MRFAGVKWCFECGVWRVESGVITTKELKKEIGTYQYDTLTGDDDRNGKRALSKATIWVQSRFLACGKDIATIDWNNELVKEALLKRASYELYSSREQEQIAKDKKEDALELLAGYLGTCVYKGIENNSDENITYPVAVVRRGGE